MGSSRHVYDGWCLSANTSRSKDRGRTGLFSSGGAEENPENFSQDGRLEWDSNLHLFPKAHPKLVVVITGQRGLHSNVVLRL